MQYTLRFRRDLAIPWERIGQGSGLGAIALEELAMAIDILLERQQVPTTGVLTVQVNQAVHINVSAEEAQRKVSVFVLRRISNLMHGETPTLVLGERTSWRVPVHLTFPTTGDLGQIGTIDVDVTSGEMCVTPDTIAAIEAHAQSTARRTP